MLNNLNSSWKKVTFARLGRIATQHIRLDNFVFQIIQPLDKFADRLQSASHVRMCGVLHQVLHGLAGTVNLIGNL
ncbi:hypothetical protein D3C75_1102590 [compost metagenome]